MSEAIAVVLAAGRGTRMKSDLPKVLFPALGRPMLNWVLDSLAEAGISRSIVVVGYRADDVRQELAGRENVEFALQEQQKRNGARSANLQASPCEARWSCHGRCWRLAPHPTKFCRQSAGRIPER